MDIQELIVSELQNHRFGASVRELSKTMRQDSSLVHEHLLVLVAMGDATQRQVGRDQVFMLTKRSGQKTDPAQAVAPVPTAPARATTVVPEPVQEAAPQPAPAPVAAPEPEPVAEVAPVVEEAPAPAPVAAHANAPAPTIYDRIGGVLVLEIGDKPITARFSSVEQLQRFVNDLIEGERAAA